LTATTSAAGVAIRVTATARNAVDGAEVVITATGSNGPLIEAGRLAVQRTMS